MNKSNTEPIGVLNKMNESKWRHLHGASELVLPLAKKKEVN